jgi:hypothetical protein
VGAAPDSLGFGILARTVDERILRRRRSPFGSAPRIQIEHCVVVGAPRPPADARVDEVLLQLTELGGRE